MTQVRVERLTDWSQFCGATVVVDYGDDAFIRDRLVRADRSGDMINLRFVYLPMIPVEVGRSVLVFWPDQPWRDLGISQGIFEAMTRVKIDPQMVEELKIAGLKVVEDD